MRIYPACRPSNLLWKNVPAVNGALRSVRTVSSKLTITALKSLLLTTAWNAEPAFRTVRLELSPLKMALDAPLL
jgi:hypothetical protein